ncbi:EAL domain-containing protein [Neptuniibacter sp.]|uniref:putative bifunctional diguanylate cyclase/phosphodiesterase n=1 Tax=Neptuniibacter sp. TaxID=1962643 RepID=UPI002636B346|nr:EAL domain-containing protein [Neptuniibacter sp.]MCP4597527.1 EAL domain-containing protein [Neptuniibacter sp.]
MAGLANLRLSSKLHILVAVVAIGLGAMALLMAVTLKDVQHLSKQTASEQAISLVDNARFGRKLSKFLLDVKLFESGFYNDMAYLNEEGARIQAELHDLVLNAPTQYQQLPIREYARSFREYLQICSSINLALEQQALLSLSLHTQLDLLESKLTKWLVDATVEGRDVYFYEQILALITGYRETLLKIDRQQAEHEGYMLRRTSSDWFVEIMSLIDDLILRLDTATASTPEISLVTSSMQDNLRLFKRSHVVLEEKTQALWRYSDANHATATKALGVLERSEEVVEETALELGMLLDEIIDTSRERIVLILIAVLFITLLSVTLIIKRNIRKPLDGLIQGIQAFQEGDLDKQVDLKRRDEWDDVQTALNQMAHALRVSYDNIQDKQDSLTHLAHHDVLTGLPNRLMLMEQLQHTIHKSERSGERFALLFMDLDRFKNVNDSLGHAAGDKLLIEVSKRLSASVRKMDTPARLGGDEFTVILDSIEDPKDAAKVAHNLIDAFSRVVEIEGRDLYVTTSIGISFYPEDGKGADELVRNADAAMYKAKQNGRNGYQFYTEKMTQEAFTRMELESSLHKAVKENEFIVFYQPKLELKSGKVVGAEALVRWHHSEHGLISPDSFIPVAEETGLVVDIDFWVLRSVCLQLKDWDELSDQGEALVVSVNFSARHMEQSNLTERVKAVIDEIGIEASRIEIEVTESLIMNNMQVAMQQLQELREAGFKIAIDDFGTGYSSLSYLKNLPVDTLKIDRAFVSDLENDRHDAAIARSIISLGNDLGLAVIAEGVECQAHLDFLAKEGCQFGQGFFFERPIPAAEFYELLEDADKKMPQVQFPSG